MALFITRSTRAVDTAGPTAPTITATAASTSTVTIERTASASDPSGIAYYDTQRSLAGADSWTTFDSSSTSPLTASGLSPSTAYDFRQRGVDTLGNLGSFSATASATTQGGTGSETVGSYAAMNLASQAVYRINSSLGDVPVWVVESAAHTLLPTGCWDGGPCHRVTPIPIGGGPTGQGNAGLGLFDVRSRGAGSIRKLNCRFEVSFGPSWISRLVQMTKWIICHSSNTPTGDPNGERPMYYLSDMDTQAGDAPAALQRGDLMAIGVASGTVKNFEPLQSGNPGYNWPRGREDFLFGASATTISGKRIVPLTDWYTVEIEMISESTVQWPNGLIRTVVWNRAGEQLTDLYIPWNWDGGWSVGDYLTAVEIIGGYGNATTVDSDTYQLLANFTFAANRPGLIGTRAGFVT